MECVKNNQTKKCGFLSVTKDALKVEFCQSKFLSMANLFIRVVKLKYLQK